MKFSLVAKESGHREEFKALLRQIDRSAEFRESSSWAQFVRQAGREMPDLVFGELDEPCTEPWREALSLQRNLRIAVLVDDSSFDTVLRYLRSGVHGVIPRQLDGWLIVRALEIVMLGGRYAPPEALHPCLVTDCPAPGRAWGHGADPRRYGMRTVGDCLSQRQHEIMRLLQMGNTNKTIARVLGISEGTVKIHMGTIFKALGAPNRAAAVALYNGWHFGELQVLNPPLSNTSVDAEHHSRLGAGVLPHPARDPGIPAPRAEQAYPRIPAHAGTALLQAADSAMNPARTGTRIASCGSLPEEECLAHVVAPAIVDGPGG